MVPTLLLNTQCGILPGEVGEKREEVGEWNEWIG